MTARRVIGVDMGAGASLSVLLAIGALENPGPAIAARFPPKAPRIDGAERMAAAEVKRQRKNARRAAQFHRSEP